MEDWLYYSLSIAFCLALSLLLSSLRPTTGMPSAVPSLPPGPTALLAIGPLLLLGRTSFGIELIIRTARFWYGPILTIYFLSTPVIFVADRAVARRVLVQRGAAFATRPRANLPTRIFTNDQHTITSAAYGPLWRVLRRNLAVKVLHPSCLRRHAAARRRAVAGLVAGVAQRMRGEGVVVVEGLLHRALSRVAVIMCFGDGLGDAVVASVTALQREFLASVVGFQVFGAVPAITKLLFRRRLKRMLSIRRRQEELLAPLIRTRRAQRDAATGDGNIADEDCYADSLLSLRIPEDGGRNLRARWCACAPSS
ncbi:cytochrome P450 89A2-like [Panicum miliaceum]|uniref:Cytochrome P450 89A2-like n=1 Tax=Panicum miliaceum TaxID=4540 RepID=A0A3L6PNW1_PANMI|nr:cytochrome P450 89A2-like [Panicum miliaceum]